MERLTKRIETKEELVKLVLEHDKLIEQVNTLRGKIDACILYLKESE